LSHEDFGFCISKHSFLDHGGYPAICTKTLIIIIKSVTIYYDEPADVNGMVYGPLFDS
jgi:hypothetical protein